MPRCAGVDASVPSGILNAPLVGVPRTWWQHPLEHTGPRNEAEHYSSGLDRRLWTSMGQELGEDRPEGIEATVVAGVQVRRRHGE